MYFTNCRLTYAVLLAFVLATFLLHACYKDEVPSTPEPQKPPKLAKIIDWDSPYGNDTSDAFRVIYTGDNITKIENEYGDAFTFQYEQGENDYGGLSRINRLRQSSNYANADTINFQTDTFGGLLHLSSNDFPFTAFSSKVALFKTNPSSAEENVDYFSVDAESQNHYKVKYDIDGDIVNIEYYFNDNGRFYLNKRIEAFYSDVDNTLGKSDRFLNLIDPSSRYAEFRWRDGEIINGNIYPFTIYYGKKCLADFKYTRYRWNVGDTESTTIDEVSKSVSYQFNQHGYITKILVDSAPFKEFVYAE